MNRQPLVSVVIPMFNAAAWIHETLGSVFSTGYEELEVIIVDDQSTDGSAGLVADYQQSNPARRIQLLFSPDGRKLGASGARNLGVSRSSGDYVAFLDADDLYKKHRFFLAISVLEQNPDLDAVFGCFEFQLVGAGETGEIRDIDTALVEQVAKQELLSPVGDFLREHLNGKSAIHTSTVTIRKKSFERLGGFPDLKYGEDDSLWLRLFGSQNVRRIPESPVSVYRIHSSSLCSSGIESPEFLFGPVGSKIDAVKFLKGRGHLANAQKVLRTIPDRLYHRYPVIRNHPNRRACQRLMLKYMRDLLLLGPLYCCDRRFISILVRLLVAGVRSESIT